MDEPERSVPLPGPLRLLSSLPFVGRWDQLGALASALEAAAAGSRRVVLVGGEAGSGKSRLVREFARIAYGEGSVVLHGACDPVVRTPYGPFLEALEHLVRFAPPDRLRAVIGPAAGELTRLIPDLPSRIGALPAPMEADQDTERYRLYSAVSDLLTGVSTVRPVVLVLEDGTGRIRRRCSCSGTSPVRSTPGCWWSPPSGTPRPRCRPTFCTPLVDLRRSDGVGADPSGSAQPGRPARLRRPCLGRACRPGGRGGGR